MVKKLINVRLGLELVNEIKEYSKITNISQSDIIRLSLIEYFNNHKLNDLQRIYSKHY